MGSWPLPEHDPQRVGDVEPVFAVAGDYERGHGLDATGEQAKDVERGLVRPVQILDDEDDRSPCVQLLHERAGNLVGHCAALDERDELASDRVRDLDQRAERPGREQRVAGAAQNGRPVDLLVAERADKSSLADAGLASEQDDVTAARTLDFRQAVDQRRQLGVALEQAGRRRARLRGL